MHHATSFVGNCRGNRRWRWWGQMSVTIRFRDHSFCYNISVFLAKQQWGRFGGIYSGVLRALPVAGGIRARSQEYQSEYVLRPIFCPKLSGSIWAAIFTSFGVATCTKTIVSCIIQGEQIFGHITGHIFGQHMLIFRAHHGFSVCTSKTIVFCTI